MKGRYEEISRMEEEILGYRYMLLHLCLINNVDYDDALNEARRLCVELGYGEVEALRTVQERLAENGRIER